MILIFARGKRRPQSPTGSASSIPADRIAPVVRDEGIEFQALVDKAPMQAPGERRLFDPPPTGPARRRLGDLAAAGPARPPLHPPLGAPEAKYRGVPVHIEGTALRVLSYEVNLELAGAVGPDLRGLGLLGRKSVVPLCPGVRRAAAGASSRARPLPQGQLRRLLPQAPRVHRAGDKWRAAPLLVGRLAIKSAPPAAPGPMVEVREFSRRNGFLVVVVLLVGYVLARAFFQIRRFVGPARPVGPHPLAEPGSR